MDTTVAVRGLGITKAFRGVVVLDRSDVSAVLGAPVGRAVVAPGGVSAGIAVRGFAAVVSPMFRIRCGSSTEMSTCALLSEGITRCK
jgi:hypothetical protein